jgi:hypothetical protein
VGQLFSGGGGAVAGQTYSFRRHRKKKLFGKYFGGKVKIPNST